MNAIIILILQASDDAYRWATQIRPALITDSPLTDVNFESWGMFIKWTRLAERRVIKELNLCRGVGPYWRGIVTTGNYLEGWMAFAFGMWCTCTWSSKWWVTKHVVPRSNPTRFWCNENIDFTTTSVSDQVIALSLARAFSINFFISLSRLFRPIRGRANRILTFQLGYEQRRFDWKL